jgi:hypothetical protein
METQAIRTFLSCRRCSIHENARSQVCGGNIPGPGFKKEETTTVIGCKGVNNQANHGPGNVKWLVSVKRAKKKQQMSGGQSSTRLTNQTLERHWLRMRQGFISSDSMSMR